MNPERIELEHRESSTVGALLDNLEILKSQRTKLQHAVERLIDSFTEGLIEKAQFTSRMDRTKRRIADLDVKIVEDAGNVDQREHLRLATTRLRELATPLGQSWQARTGNEGGKSSGRSCSESTLTPRSLRLSSA